MDLNFTRHWSPTDRFGPHRFGFSDFALRIDCGHRERDFTINFAYAVVGAAPNFTVVGPRYSLIEPAPRIDYNHQSIINDFTVAKPLSRVKLEQALVDAYELNLLHSQWLSHAIVAWFQDVVAEVNDFFTAYCKQAVNRREQRRLDHTIQEMIAQANRDFQVPDES